MTFTFVLFFFLELMLVLIITAEQRNRVARIFLCLSGPCLYKYMLLSFLFYKSE